MEECFGVLQSIVICSILWWSVVEYGGKFSKSVEICEMWTIMMMCGALWCFVVDCGAVCRYVGVW